MALTENQKKELRQEIVKLFGGNGQQLTEEDIFEKLNVQNVISLEDVKDLCREMFEARELKEVKNSWNGEVKPGFWKLQGT